MDGRAAAIPGMLAQRDSRAVGKIAAVCRNKRRARGGQGDLPGGEQGDFIGKGDGLHQHVHLVIAVRPSGQNIQRPVDFCARDDPHGHPSVLVLMHTEYRIRRANASKERKNPVAALDKGRRMWYSSHV